VKLKDQVAILLDDMVDTAGTLTLAADALKREGAKKILAAVLTPCFPDRDSTNRGIATGGIDCYQYRAFGGRCATLSQDQSIVRGSSHEAIRRTHDEESISSLFV
jgi:ribose-phosphate pyrophosphokinase